MREEYKRFVNDEGMEIEEDGVTFRTESAANDFVEKARKRRFDVAMTKFMHEGAEAWIVMYTGD